MELLIVSGLSGAGKSVAMNALEDIGYFCVDNIPASVLPKFVELSLLGDEMVRPVAIAMDIRGTRSSQEIEQALAALTQQQISYHILFLGAGSHTLQNRYKETRRRHPISLLRGVSTVEAIALEEEIVSPLREQANYTVDTSVLSTAQLKERICSMFLPSKGGAKGAMMITVLSFGFKFGLPEEADLVFDVRCLPNPFYQPELKHKTGNDQEVFDFVMQHDEAQSLLGAIDGLLATSLPLYVKEGKSQLTVAVGCTGGKHRSITFARQIAAHCETLGYHPVLQHRDEKR
ncbi:MAG: RNase adapter RapZ [Faecalibacterium sp.]